LDDEQRVREPCCDRTFDGRSDTFFLEAEKAINNITDLKRIGIAV
jgi:hypothetical protein